MAATAMVALLRPLRRWPAVRAAALLAVGVVAAVPGSWGTWQRIGEFWNAPTFADQAWDLDGGFRYGTWLADRARAEGEQTVMVPTPDATMVWYYSGEKVVYLYPTAAIKLAFDVRKLTGYGTDERGADLTSAFSGDPGRMAELAARYGAGYVVLRRDGDWLGAVDLPAAALRSGKKEGRMVETNHYEWLTLGQDDVSRFEFFSPTDGQATVTCGPAGGPTPVGCPGT
jgi:hypothetical protein